MTNLHPGLYSQPEKRNLGLDLCFAIVRVFTNVSQEEERVAPDQVTAEPETTPPCTGESETAQAVVAQDEPETTPPAEPETVQAVVTLDEPETANIRKDAEQEDEPI